jgi:transglutaminase-like putative cysteine protease
MNVVRLLLWSAMAIVAWWVLGGGHGAVSGPVGMLLGVLVCFAGIVILGWKGGSVTSAQGGGWTRFIRISAWLALIVTVLFWLGVATKGPVREMVSVWEQTFDPPPASETTNESRQEETTGHMDWNEGSRRALPRKTNLKPGKKPEVFLRIEDRAEAVRLSKGPIYLSSLAYDQYQDSAWHIASESPTDMQADASGVITLERDANGDGIWHTIVMSADAKRRTPLVALQGVSRVEGLKSMERWSPALHLLPEPEEPTKGYRYRASSRPMALKDIAESDRCEPDGSHDPNWLRLPQDALGKRLAELAQSVATGDSLSEKARQIQTHLRNSYEYSLSTANRRNLDPLENFLFGEKSGHCEYFATAGALMARAVGIPSRVMYGWAGGTWYEHADWFVFRADEAHVWVELWLGRHGWVVMDPTPPEALRTQANSTSKEKLPSMPGAVVEETSEEEATQPASTMPWIASALIVLAGLVVLLWPSARAADGEEKRIIPEPWRERVSMHYMEEWKKAAKARLPRRPTGSTTLRQQIRSMHPAPEFADELLGYHYRVRYEGCPRDRTRERKLTRRIRTWAAESKE